MKVLAALSRLGLVLLLVTTLAGCDRLPWEKAEPVALRFVILPGALPYARTPQIIKEYERLAEQFHEAHPEITVTIEELDAREMLTEAGEFSLEQVLAGETPADVILSPAHFVAQLQSLGLLLPVQPYLEREEGLSAGEFAQAALQQLQVESQTYALPAWMNPTVLHYNETLLAELGLGKPPMVWDWDDFMTLAQQAAVAQSQRQFALAIGPGDALPWLLALGGSLYDDPQTPRAVTLGEETSQWALEQLKQLMDLGVVPQPQAVAAYEPPEGGVTTSVVMMSDGSGEMADQEAWQEIMDFGLKLGSASLAGDVALWCGPLYATGVTSRGSATMGSILGQPPGDWQEGYSLLPRGEHLVVPIEVAALSLGATSAAPEAAWQWVQYLLDQTPPTGFPSRLTKLADEQAIAQLSTAEAALARAMAERAGEITFISTEHIVESDALTMALWRLWQGEPWDETLDTAVTALQENIE